MLLRAREARNDRRRPALRGLGRCALGGCALGGPVVRVAGLVLLAFLAPVRAAQADGEDDPRAADDALRSELLAGTSDGEWRGVLETRVLARDTGVVGRVLGPLFDERERYADNVACVAYVAAYLADHPVGNGRKEVLLSGSILQRAYRDEEFVAGLRKHLTAVQKVRPGWDLLVEHAKRALAPDSGSDEPARRAALWFLGREHTTATVWFLHERGKAGLGLEGGLADESNALVIEWREALGEVLAYPFPSAQSAVQLLDGLVGSSREDVLAALLRRGSPEAERDRTNAIAWGKALIAAAERPDQLKHFVDAARTPYLELRREAARRLSELAPPGQTGAPEADAAAWGSVLCVVLARGEDEEVLQRAIKILKRASFRETPAVARDLSACVASRLRTASTALGTADRARLAEILGRLGDRTAVLNALGWARSASPPIETEVLAALVRAMGQVTGVPATVALEFYGSHSGEGERDREVRLAVADALGAPGLRADPEAGAALRAMLTGEGPPALARETNPVVRDMAIQRLQSHPGPQTSAVLRAFALGSDEAEAKAALRVLGVRPIAEPSAAQALAAVVRQPGSEERRRAAIRDLAGVKPDVPAEVRAEVVDAVRGVLAASDTSDALKREALVTAAELADPGLLEGATAHLLERPDDAERRASVEALFLRVAAAGDAHDVALYQAIDRMAEGGAHDLAVALATGMSEQTGRPLVLAARARALHARARDERRSEGDRRRDLEDARALLESASSPPQEAARVLHLQMRIHEDLGALLPAGAQRNEALLQAVELAANPGVRTLAPEGERVARLLEQYASTTPLSDDQRQRLHIARGKLERILRPPG